jgi:hypothetical protein
MAYWIRMAEVLENYWEAHQAIFRHKREISKSDLAKLFKTLGEAFKDKDSRPVELAMLFPSAKKIAMKQPLEPIELKFLYAKENPDKQEIHMEIEWNSRKSETKQEVGKGMEGKKSDRPRWVSRVFDQFVRDFRDGVDPTINMKHAVDDLESRRVDPNDLKIFVILSKDPACYQGNHPNKIIVMQLGKKGGEIIIWYYETDSGISIEPEDISITKYKQMLMSTMKDALEILGYGNSESIASEVFEIKKIPENEKGKEN